jgi:hypothetical protein
MHEIKIMNRAFSKWFEAFLKILILFVEISKKLRLFLISFSKMARLFKYIFSRIEAFLKGCEAFQKIRASEAFFKDLKRNGGFFQ